MPKTITAPVRSIDLGSAFRNLRKRVPVAPERRFDFRESSFPPLPREFVSDRIVIVKSTHDYGASCQSDQVQIYSDKQTFRHLALLLLGVVLKAIPKLTVNLSNPGSEVKRVLIKSEWAELAKNISGYGSKPTFFKYRTGNVLRHPWINSGTPLGALPSFKLTNEKDAVYSEEARRNRDTLIGFGSDEAMVRLAELMLNMSRPECKINEVELEGEPGFRGVAPRSAEAMLRLPGSFGWEFRWRFPKGKRR